MTDDVVQANPAGDAYHDRRARARAGSPRARQVFNRES